LQKLLRDQQDSFNQSMQGQTVSVLFDRAGRHDGQIHGRTPYMQAVHVQGIKELIGAESLVRINHVGQNSLSGQIVLD